MLRTSSSLSAALTPPTDKKLKGRFLQLTDLHPDPWYTPGSSTKKACHRKKPKKKNDRAAQWGTSFSSVYALVLLFHALILRVPSSDCDSPLSLTNYTLDYLNKDWASEIDFVICTSSPANGRSIP
jgi:endopolyphosphatase